MMDSVITEPAQESECAGLYLVRIGYQRQVIPIHSGVVQLERGVQIICRTSRGVEMGEVLTTTESEYIDCNAAGRFIRKSRPEDQLLWRQLTSLSVDASVACQSFLQGKASPDVLLEVEPLMDGRTLYFHFLGTPSPETELRVQELSEIFQRSVASSRFAALLEHGCGPGCGTKEKSGCGTGGGCAVCAIAGGCTTKK